VVQALDVVAIERLSMEDQRGKNTSVSLVCAITYFRVHVCSFVKKAIRG
jgi:hypothetical protein